MPVKKRTSDFPFKKSTEDPITQPWQERPKTPWRLAQTYDVGRFCFVSSRECDPNEELKSGGFLPTLLRVTHTPNKTFYEVHLSGNNTVGCYLFAYVLDEPWVLDTR